MTTSVAFCPAGRTVRQSTQVLHDAILDIFHEMKPTLTVRQVYYQLVVRGLVEKSQTRGYRQAQYQLATMRRSGRLPYGWIADNTRWQIKPRTFKGLEAALERWQAEYRRDIWADQPVHVEIWVEKDALAGVISPITKKYDVPLMVARGFSSMTFTYEAAEAIKEIGKPAYIYQFGDYDPSGVAAAETVRDDLASHGAEIHFERVAVTPEQIEKYSLPVRETKRKDPRAKNWGDRPSVELDALPPNQLRELVKNCIEQHIDRWTLSQVQRIERQEREMLASVDWNFVPVQNSSAGATP